MSPSDGPPPPSSSRGSRGQDPTAVPGAELPVLEEVKRVLNNLANNASQLTDRLHGSFPSIFLFSSYFHLNGFVASTHKLQFQE